MADGGQMRQVATALRDLTVREYSILPQDIHSAATNIALVTGGQRKAVSDIIVVYDATYGSLRLTEPVFEELDVLIGRLERSSELSPNEDSLVAPQVARALRDWFDEFESVEDEDYSSLLQAGPTAETNGLR